MRKTGAVVAAAIATMVLAGVSQGRASAPQSPLVIPLEQFRKSVAIRAVVAGKERLFMFDTGGGVSFISPELANELKCERGARIVGFRMTGDKLEAPRCDNVELTIAKRRFVVPVAGVYQVGEFAAQGVKIDGLIALDIVAGRTATLDFAGKRLILETARSAQVRTHSAVELPATIAHEIGGRATAAYVQVPSPHGPLAFELDSGNGGTLLIAKPYATAFGFPPEKGPQLGSVPLGRGIDARGMVMPADITLDGNLGMPFLKDYLVTLDLARGRVWFVRNPVPAPEGMGTPPPPKPA